MHYTAHIVLLYPLVLQVDGLSHLVKRVVALTDVRYGIQSGCIYVTESLDKYMKICKANGCGVHKLLFHL